MFHYQEETEKTWRSDKNNIRKCQNFTLDLQNVFWKWYNEFVIVKYFPKNIKLIGIPKKWRKIVMYNKLKMLRKYYQ